MREGYWLVAATGAYRLVDDHARWIQRPENARFFGFSEEVILALSEIHGDFNGQGRRAILELAMDQGLIRSRGHGPVDVTFECTMDLQEAIRGIAPFMAATLGPLSVVKVNQIRTGECIAFTYGEARKLIEAGDISALLPPWKRPAMAVPVARPFLLLNGVDMVGEWTCWPLPDHLTSHELVALLRVHVPNASGWLALADGRTWRLSPGAPPLTPLDTLNPALASKACPECGWPSGSKDAPCQCKNLTVCRVCSMPIFWPIPGRDFLNIQGASLYVPTFVGYAHRCVYWPSVRVLPFDDLIRRGR